MGDLNYTCVTFIACVILVLLIILYMLHNLIPTRTRIIYRKQPINKLDHLFSSENFPSRVYASDFRDDSPWIGGFKISYGKTVLPKKK